MKNLNWKTYTRKRVHKHGYWLYQQKSWGMVGHFHIYLLNAFVELNMMYNILCLVKQKGFITVRIKLPRV